MGDVATHRKSVRSLLQHLVSRSSPKQKSRHVLCPGTRFLVNYVVGDVRRVELNGTAARGVLRLGGVTVYFFISCVPYRVGIMGPNPLLPVGA